MYVYILTYSTRRDNVRKQKQRIQMKTNPTYLDCNATTPVEPEVASVVQKFIVEEYGNAASRTHEYGTRAKQAIQKAREQIAAVVSAEPDEVTFTSGATESNNLALLGLADHAAEVGRKHIISTAIEHKAVLEPLSVLHKRGFDVTLVSPSSGGWVEPDQIRQAMRSDTILVSVMQVNNETGVIQPIPEIASLLEGSDIFFHVDAAQGFGKDISTLKNGRVDLISISGHKVYGPKGIGALVVRKREFTRPPLKPLMYGGGQERGLRPGTLPVHLIVGLGLASEMAVRFERPRKQACLDIREEALRALQPLNPVFNGDPARTAPHVLNLSFAGLDSEAVIVALKGIAAISNGSACTSASYSPSHVLQAMGLPSERIQGAIRLSWCHMTPKADWHAIAKKIATLRS